MSDVVAVQLLETEVIRREYCKIPEVDSSSSLCNDSHDLLHLNEKHGHTTVILSSSHLQFDDRFKRQDGNCIPAHQYRFRSAFVSHKLTCHYRVYLRYLAERLLEQRDTVRESIHTIFDGLFDINMLDCGVDTYVGELFNGRFGFPADVSRPV